MIIEYLNESTDILASKVVDGELTIEAASDAYNEIADKAINEYVNEVLDAVDEGIFTASEASLIFELCGISESDFAVTEADYDLSGLSPAKRKEIMDKYNDMTDAQKKKADKVLAKQYPSAEYKAKMEKRKKMLTGAGIGAGVALAAGAAYGAHKVNQAEKFARATDKAYKSADEKRDAALKNLNDTTLYGVAMKAGKEGKKAREELDAMRPKDQRKHASEYVSRQSDIYAQNAADAAEIRNKKMQRQGKIGYYKNILKDYRDAGKIDKDTRKRILQNRNEEEEERQWAKSRKGKTLGIKVKNIFRPNGDKLYDPGFTDKGIEKKLDADYGEERRDIAKKAEDAKTGLFSRHKK